jgi:hypothetical protein
VLGALAGRSAATAGRLAAIKTRFLDAYGISPGKLRRTCSGLFLGANVIDALAGRVDDAGRAIARLGGGAERAACFCRLWFGSGRLTG